MGDVEQPGPARLEQLAERVQRPAAGSAEHAVEERYRLGLRATSHFVRDLTRGSEISAWGFRSCRMVSKVCTAARRCKPFHSQIFSFPVGKQLGELTAGT